ncbi:hypothetical protein [Streptomyces mayteni]
MVVTWRSLVNALTPTGRLHNRWAAALADIDPERGLTKLRQVRQGLAQRPGAAAELWVPFVVSCAGDRFRALLTDDDFTDLELVGGQLALPGRFSVEQAWRPLIRARFARDEPGAANALLARLYWAEAIDEPVRAAAAAELARGRAQDDEHLPVYGDLLRRGVPRPPAVVALVIELLAVDFSAHAHQLDRAAQLAAVVRDTPDFPAAEIALGLHRLLVLDQPAAAAAHFATGCAVAPEDPTPLLGLLAALVRDGEAALVPDWAMDRAHRSPAASRLHEMAQLIEVLNWFDSSTDASPPLSAALLDTLGVALHVGPWLDYARGRVHLVEGDAAAAHALLAPLTGQRDWVYHATWAALLCDDRAVLARRAQALRATSDDWALGCLLRDAVPGRRLALPEPPPRYERIAALRVGLAGALRPTEDPGPLPPGRGSPERIEALRTALGAAFGRQPPGRLADLLRAPLYRRLPRADRLLWSGLLALRQDPAEGHRLLGEARRLGHSRADLILAAHHLEHADTGQARASLGRRSDPKSVILSVWLDTTAADWATSNTTPVTPPGIQRLTPLAANGPPQARYLLGALRLKGLAAVPERAAEQAGLAAGELNSAIAAAGDVLPSDALALAQAAEAIAGSAQHPALALIRAQQPWVTWVLGLARLADEPAAVESGIGDELLALVNRVRRPPVAALGGLAAALSKTIRRGPAPGAFRLLSRLAERYPLPTVVEPAAQAVVMAMRRQPTPYEPPASLATHPLVARALAYRDLRANDRATAVKRLRAAAEDAAAANDLSCALLADALDSRPPQEPPPEGALARLVFAAALASSAPERCLDLLTEVSDDLDLTDIVDLTRLLPAMCARLTAGRRVNPERARPLIGYLRRIGNRPRPAVAYDTLARCAAALGEFELAERHWGHAVHRAEHDARGERSPARGEYVHLQCHRAVLAYRENAPLTAARLLRAAAAAAAGDPIPNPQVGEVT